MDAGVARLDSIYQDALRTGRLSPDASLSPPPAPAPEPAPVAEPTIDTLLADIAASNAVAVTVQYDTPGTSSVANSEALIRSLPGVRSASTTSLALGGVSLMRVFVDDPAAFARPFARAGSRCRAAARRCASGGRPRPPRPRRRVRRGRDEPDRAAARMAGGPRDDAFFVTPTNARAAQLLEHWDTWPVHAALLTGPRRSGRSLLAGSSRRKAVVRSSTMRNGCRKPVCSRLEPGAGGPASAGHHRRCRAARLADHLPDLRSRLAATPHAEIGPPDDGLVRALFERQLARRGVVAPPDVLEWLVARIERSHLAIERSIDALDEGVMDGNAD